MVAFDASTSRPLTSSVPQESKSSAAASSTAPLLLETVPSVSSVSSGSSRPAAASGMANPVAVLPWAHVPGRVERQAAQRARRSALANHLDRAPGERPRCLSRDPDSQHCGAIVGNVVGQRLDRLLAFLLGLDDDPFAIMVPGKRDGAYPEVLGQRQVQRALIHNLLAQTEPGLGAGSARYLVEQFLKSLS